MKNKKIVRFLLTSTLALLVFAGCGKERNGADNTPVPSAPGNASPSVSPTVTGTPSNTPTSTPSSTPTPSPEVFLDSLEIEGLHHFNTTDKTVTHSLFLGYEAIYQGKVVGDIQMASDGKGKIAIVYSVQEDANGPDDCGSEFFLLLSSLVGNRVRVDSNISLGYMQYCWLKESGENILLTQSVNGEDDKSRRYVVTYDYDGQKLSTISLDEDRAGSIQLSGLSDYYYQFDNKTYTVTRVNIATGEKSPVEYHDKLLLKSFYGVSTINGVDYLCGSFLGVDLKEYEAVINCQTGEPLLIAGEDQVSYIYCEKDRFTINSKYNEKDGLKYRIFDGNRVISYSQKDEFYYSYVFLGDRLAVVRTSYEYHNEVFVDQGEEYDFQITDKTIIDVAIVDLATNTVISTNTIEVLSERDLSRIDIVGEDKLMLVFSDQAGSMDVYFWDLDGKKYSDYEFTYLSDIKIENFTGFEVVKVEGNYVRSDFVPGECPDLLKEEREYADELEKKYDIKIYIADEAKCLMSGYIFEILNDKAKLRECLETMDKEFAKYPQGFFSLYKKLPYYPDGLEIFFTGGLIGYESGNLDRAGGLRTEDEDSINIALDGYDGRYEAAVHHEISHSIEVLIRHLSSEDLDEDIWNGINIKYGGDRKYYAQSYMHQDSDWYYGYKKNYKYTYESWEWYPNKYSQVLFTDDYAMTYPTEDRSRLFEQIMWDKLDVSVFPALKEKITYYSKLIKKMLVENGFSPDAECYWEWVLKNE